LLKLRVFALPMPMAKIPVVSSEPEFCDGVGHSYYVASGAALRGACRSRILGSRMEFAVFCGEGRVGSLGEGQKSYHKTGEHMETQGKIKVHDTSNEALRADKDFYE